MNSCKAQNVRSYTGSDVLAFTRWVALVKYECSSSSTCFKLPLFRMFVWMMSVKIGIVHILHTALELSPTFRSNAIQTTFFFLILFSIICNKTFVNVFAKTQHWTSRLDCSSWHCSTHYNYSTGAIMVENWQIFGRSRSRNSKPSFGSRYIRNCVSSETVLCIDCHLTAFIDIMWSTCSLVTAWRQKSRRWFDHCGQRCSYGCDLYLITAEKMQLQHHRPSDRQ